MFVRRFRLGAASAPVVGRSIVAVVVRHHARAGHGHIAVAAAATAVVSAITAATPTFATFGLAPFAFATAFACARVATIVIVAALRAYATGVTGLTAIVEKEHTTPPFVVCKLLRGRRYISSVCSVVNNGD